MEGQYLLSLSEAYRWVNDFIRFYNGHRIHGSLGMSSVEFTKRLDLHGQEKFAQAI